MRGREYAEPTVLELKVYKTIRSKIKCNLHPSNSAANIDSGVDFGSGAKGRIEPRSVCVG